MAPCVARTSFTNAEHWSSLEMSCNHARKRDRFTQSKQDPGSGHDRQHPESLCHRPQRTHKLKYPCCRVACQGMGQWAFVQAAGQATLLHWVAGARSEHSPAHLNHHWEESVQRRPCTQSPAKRKSACGRVREQGTWAQQAPWAALEFQKP